jgi:hypothetical protein
MRPTTRKAAVSTCTPKLVRRRVPEAASLSSSILIGQVGVLKGIQMGRHDQLLTGNVQISWNRGGENRGSGFRQTLV